MNDDDKGGHCAGVICTKKSKRGRGRAGGVYWRGKREEVWIGTEESGYRRGERI